MATWTKADGEPVTTQSRTRVRSVESGEEGYANITWRGKGHGPRFFGPITSLTSTDPRDGTEPFVEILDNKPVFA